MKFSISTSFYKRGHLAESVYQQVLDQTYTNWEWIVTDDFSEENSAREKLLEICAKDHRVKYYEQSRKKECFYNPQRGATGDIIIMFDSDDYAYPKVLEVYHHMFTKHPEIAGISCFARVIDNNLNGFDGIYPYNIFPSDYGFNTNVLGLTPMCRAFKNVFSEFDNGSLQFHQNDTNIVRHIETIGKWLYLPRVLYNYDKTDNSSISRKLENPNAIEDERLFIEHKFPQLHHPDRFSLLTYYFSILDTARILSFGDFNYIKGTRNILLIDSNIKLYEKQLLKELYYDHNIYYDYTLNQNFDEIAIKIDDTILDNLNNIKNTLLSTGNTNKRIYFMMNPCNENFNFVFESIKLIFGGVGYIIGPGCEAFLITGT